MILTIPGSLPGLNDMLDAARRNKYQAAQQKKEATELVAWLARQQKIPHMKFIDLSITWYETNKKRDKDNIQAAVKFILDGLVAAGVIANDNWRNVGDITHKVRLDRQNARIEVELKEVEG
jgi:Holliday junction resolvase RusA-like endonuclease